MRRQSTIRKYWSTCLSVLLLACMALACGSENSSTGVNLGDDLKNESLVRWQAIPSHDGQRQKFTAYIGEINIDAVGTMATNLISVGPDHEITQQQVDIHLAGSVHIQPLVANYTDEELAGYIDSLSLTIVTGSQTLGAPEIMSVDAHLTGVFEDRFSIAKLVPIYVVLSSDDDRMLDSTTVDLADLNAGSSSDGLEQWL